MIKQLLNPNAMATNLVQLTKNESGCCGDGSLNSCKYTVTFATSATLQVITYKDPITGTNKTLTIAAGTNTKRKVEKALHALPGYAMVGGTNVRYRTSGSNTIIELFGEAEFVSVTTSASTVNFVKTCTQTYKCLYSFRTNGSTTLTAVLNGTAISVGNIVYGTQTAAEAKTALESALPTATSVTVIADTVAALWNVVIKMPAGTSLILDGVEGVQHDCEIDYIA